VWQRVKHMGSRMGLGFSKHVANSEVLGVGISKRGV